MSRRLTTLFLLLCSMLAVAPLVWAQGPPAFTVDEMLKLKRVSDPQLSPDGTKVAFVVTDVSLEGNSRNNDIWMASLDGGRPVKIAGTDRSEDRPRWSPDGKQLAFVSNREGGTQVWVIPASGGEPKKLTTIATGASGVTWSPDGKWIAFVSEVFPACADAACNERELKARDASKVKAHLADGLMFRHWTAWREGTFSHLFIMPADGSTAPRDLTPGASDVPPFSLGGPEDYAFSPDSKEIAFAKKTDNVEAISTNSDIFTHGSDRGRRPAEADRHRPRRGRRTAVHARRQVPDVAVPGPAGVRSRPLDAEPARPRVGCAPRRDRQLGPRRRRLDLHARLEGRIRRRRRRRAGARLQVRSGRRASEARAEGRHQTATCK